MQNYSSWNIVFDSISRYPAWHPFRALYEDVFKGGSEPCLPECCGSLNTLNSLSRTLLFIKDYSEEAYADLLQDKLMAKNRDNLNLHNLISALCELSVIYTFLTSSDEKESFEYEPRLVKNKQTNPEFSIRINDIKYCVEVKSPNLVLYQNEVLKKIHDNGQVFEADVRLWTMEQTKEIVGDDVSIIGSLDNKLADFLDSAQKKFPAGRDERTVHLLIVCWDAHFDQAFAALKSPINGLLTHNTYRRHPDDSPMEYPNVSHIQINTLYQGMFEWLCGNLYAGPLTPVAMDPFNLRFYKNFCVDYNLEQPPRIKEEFDKIFGYESTVIDEGYVAAFCPENRWILEI